VEDTDFYSKRAVMKKVILASILAIIAPKVMAADIETDAYRTAVAYLCAEKMTLAGESRAASEFRGDGQNYLAMYKSNFAEFKAALSKHKARARNTATESKCRSIAGI